MQSDRARRLREEDDENRRRRLRFEKARRQTGGFFGAQQSFWAPFNDLGNGVVNTNLLVGVGVPSFTRATTATTIGSTGLVLKGIAAGVARAYYDPTTLECRGLLVEGARTSLILRSEEFDSPSWGKTDTTATADAAISPDGTQNADLLTEGSAGTAQVTQGVTATADANYACSKYLKRGNHDWLRLRVVNGANFVHVWANLATGAVGSNAVGGTATLVRAYSQAHPNGWYRFTVVANIGSGATAINFGTISADGDASNTRVNGGTRYQWGAQFEDNSNFSSSYIPTTSASVTRNLDQLTYLIAGNVLDTQGWAYAEASTFWTAVPAAVNSHIIGLTLNSALAPLTVAVGQPSTEMRVRSAAASTAKSGLTDLATGVRKRASAWGNSVQSVTGDGASVATGTFSNFGTIDAIGIGVAGGGAGHPWFGTIRNARIGMLLPPNAASFLERATA